LQLLIADLAISENISQSIPSRQREKEREREREEGESRGKEIYEIECRWEQSVGKHSKLKIEFPFDSRVLRKRGRDRFYLSLFHFARYLANAAYDDSSRRIGENTNINKQQLVNRRQVAVATVCRGNSQFRARMQK